MYPPQPQCIRLVQDVDGYARVYDTADWQIVLADLTDGAGQPYDFTDADLHLQIRPVKLPNLIVDDLSLTNGITVEDGVVTLVSATVNRSWRARETTVLVADLMMQRSVDTVTTITFLRRIHFTVEPGATQPA